MQERHSVQPGLSIANSTAQEVTQISSFSYRGAYISLPRDAKKHKTWAWVAPDREPFQQLVPRKDQSFSRMIMSFIMRDRGEKG